jgi:hypothetical protein
MTCLGSKEGGVRNLAKNWRDEKVSAVAFCELKYHVLLLHFAFWRREDISLYKLLSTLLLTRCGYLRIIPRL